MQDAVPAYRYVRERLGIDVQTADPAAQLSSFGVDSLALLELIFEIEEKFGVKVDEYTQPPLTCGELAALIDRLATGRT